MKLNHKNLFWICALLAGVAFDQLFRNQSFGINFIIFVIVATLAGLIPIWLEKIKIPWTSYGLLIPIGFFGTMTFIRAEPFTTLINSLLTIASLILFALTLRNGAWHKYRVQDFLFKGLHFFGISFIGGVLYFTKNPKTASSTINENPISSEGEQTLNPPNDLVGYGEKPQQTRLMHQIAPYVRGVLLTLPILAILAFFLAQADPIFNDRLQGFTSWFRLENLGDALFRLFSILVIAYGLLSTFYFAVVESIKFKPGDDGSSGISPFLGTIESITILGGVNLLFLLFVILQFNYLFSGGNNISAAGYTYAEYARRGFFELIVVAIISLVLFYVLSMITKRKQQNQQRLFSILGLLLVSLVSIILVSATTRLTLYEMAYGFTRMRTFAHIFMIWIGLLLVGTAVLELSKKMHRLAFVLICFIFGFGLTINLLNIDRFIVHENVTRTLETTDESSESELDSFYLTSLTADAVPALVQFFTDPTTPETVRNEVGGNLACRLAFMNEAEPRTWASFHLSHSQEARLLQDQSSNLKDYLVSNGEGTWSVVVNGEVRICYGPGILAVD